MRRTLLLLTALLLTGCINDSASYYVDGKDHALTVRAEQDYFWQDEVTLKLIAARLPDCQRQFTLANVPEADLAVELFTSGENTFTLRAGKQVWMVETQGCTLLPDSATPAFGEPLGVYKIVGDKMTFEPAAPAAAPAAPAPTAPAPAAPAPAAPPAAAATTPAQ